MAMQNGQELVVRMLSDLMQSETRLQQFAEEMSKRVQNQDAKDYFSARTKLRQENLSNLEECFRLIGAQTVKAESRFRDVWIEDVNRELEAIQNPAFRAIYAIGTIKKIQQFHMSEYAILRTVARLTGNFAVVALLDHNLADKVATAEETDELIGAIARTAFQMRQEKAA